MDQITDHPITTTVIKKPNRGARITAVIIFSGLCALTGACATGVASGSSASSSRNDSTLACEHFRNIAYDASNGLLTPTELRTKLKQVYSNAAIATPAVQLAAQRMVAASTSLNYTALGNAVEAMGSACTATGN